MQSLATRSDNWTPPIVKTVASEGRGIPELAASISGYENFLKKENLMLKHNVQNWRDRLFEMLREAMLDKARAQLSNGEAERLAAEVAEHKRDPYTVVEEIVAKASRNP
jgi:LAO/AO transport system kinase